MATTEMESGSSEHGTFDPDSKYPLKVLYCGGMTCFITFYSVWHIYKIFVGAFSKRFVCCFFLSAVCSLPTEVSLYLKQLVIFCLVFVAQFTKTQMCLFFEL